MTILDSPKMYKTADGTLYHWVPKHVRWAPSADMILDGAFTADNLAHKSSHKRHDLSGRTTMPPRCPPGPEI
jgi:hypothetical protein